MIEAGLWGFVGGIGLLIGAVIGLTMRTSPRTIGLVMGFGAGVLISALAFELTHEAYLGAGVDVTGLGLAAGAIAFFAFDLYLDRRGARHRKRSGGQQESGSATAIVLGALMDGIPESIVIGVSLFEREAVGGAVVAAVFLSNVPESLSAATGLKKAGHSGRYVLGLWAAVCVSSAVAAALGYAFLGEISPEVIAGIQAFAAGAILTMLADTMMPEAFENGGSVVGLVTVLGFASAFFLSTLE